jgi:hypothetical protein
MNKEMGCYMRMISVLFFVALFFTTKVFAVDVIEQNVLTGNVTQRAYTQKENDDIVASLIANANTRILEIKNIDISKKREAAIEGLIITATSTESVDYKDSLK